MMFHGKKGQYINLPDNHVYGDLAYKVNDELIYDTLYKDRNLLK